MAADGRSTDWRVPAFWAAALALSMAARVPVEIADAGRRGIDMGVGRAVALEGASHLVVAALLPAIYWLHRRWPVVAGPRNIAIHVLAVVPYSVLHTLGMAALRLLWFNAIVGGPIVSRSRPDASVTDSPGRHLLHILSGGWC
jgi:hypothetical protein